MNRFDDAPTPANNLPPLPPSGRFSLDAIKQSVSGAPSNRFSDEPAAIVKPKPIAIPFGVPSASSQDYNPDTEHATDGFHNSIINYVRTKTLIPQAAKLIKETVQGTARSAGSIGQTISEALPGGTDEFKTPTLPVLKQISKFLYGDTPVPSLSKRVAEGELTAKDYGFGKLSLPVSLVFVGGTTALDFTPLGGEESVVKNLVKEQTIEGASRILKEMGVADDLIPDYARAFAKAKTAKEVQTGLDTLKEIEKTTKPVRQFEVKLAEDGATNIPKALEPLANEARNFDTVEEFRSNITPAKLRTYLNETEDAAKAKTASATATGAKTRLAGDYFYKQDREAFDALLTDIKEGRNTLSGAVKGITEFYNEARGTVAPISEAQDLERLQKVRATRLPAQSGGQGSEDLLKSSSRNPEIHDELRPVAQDNYMASDESIASVAKDVKPAQELTRPTIDELKKMTDKQVVDRLAVLEGKDRKALVESLSQVKDPEGVRLFTDNQITRINDMASEGTRIKPPVGRGGLQPPELHFADWNDKGALSLNRETMERNLDRVAGHDAPAVKKFLVEPVRINETERIRFANDLREETRAKMSELGIKRGSKEDKLVMQYGEKKIELFNLKQEAPQKWEQIQEAAVYFRQKYDELLGMVNKERIKFGYNPIPKREEYFRHYMEIGNSIKNFGLIFRENELPTEISGMTSIFKPGKPFSTAELQRKGGAFTPSAIGGFDNYIDTITKQIYHIDSVQRARVLEKYIRDTAKAVGQAAKTGEEAIKLQNFVGNLWEYGNLLSGKKAAFDRAFEGLLGRPFYSVMNWIRGRTGANMVLANVSSAITNFIPITQALATTEKPAALHGLFESLMSPLKKDFTAIDGISSDYLTRRYPEKYIFPTIGQKVSNVAGSIFETIDRFTSKFVTAGKYYESLSNGATPEEAMKIADEYAGKVLADRSLGNLPNIMSSKALGVFTQFQSEVNNMYSFLVRDIPQMSEGSKTKIISSLVQFTVYSYLFNNIYEEITGRRPTIDPVYDALTLAGLTNDGEKRSFGKRAVFAMKDVVGNLPFGNLIPLGGISGGGRLPIAAGIPNLSGIIDGSASKTKEVAKFVALFAAPGGGLQIKKSIEGLADYEAGSSKTAAGKVKYRIKKTASNFVRSGLFGRYSTPEAVEYYQRQGQDKKSSSKSSTSGNRFSD